MITIIAHNPIEDILANPDTYIPDDQTVGLVQFNTSTGPVIISLGYDDRNCLYYFVKTYPSFNYTIRCDANELQSVYDSILKEFSED